MEEAMGKVFRAAETIMQNTTLLQHKVNQLHMENRHQRQRQAAPRAFIQTGGSLTGAKGVKSVRTETIVEKALLLFIRSRCIPARGLFPTSGWIWYRTN